jgi:hypothetical protein
VSIEALRKQARILMWLITVPFAALILVAAVVIGNVVWQGGRYADVVLIWYLPMFLYLWAIWMVRDALRTIARGEMFNQVVPKLLFRVGLALFAGALFNEIGKPLITALIYGKAWMRTFEASGVTLGVMGATLALVAQLLRRAAAMRDELDGFF